MKREKRKQSIFLQVAILFLISIVATGIFTYVSENYICDVSVKQQTQVQAEKIANEAKMALKEYPAYAWLVRYWYTHADTMDIEYDAEFDGDSLTSQKVRLFTQRHPDLQLRYMNEEQCRALSAEDKQLYAEIAYSWLISRIDQIKQSYNVSYLFCVIAKEPFDQQFFLFSGAEHGAVRGTGYEDAYILGHTVSVNKSQTEAMRSASKYYGHLADAGKYVDYYTLIWSFDGNNVMIGLTYAVPELESDVQAQTRLGATIAWINQLLLSVICMALLLYFILRPLKRVQFHIRNYKETKESEPVIAGLESIRSRNEIGRLADDVSEMVREIDAHIEQLTAITAEKERIGTELALATRIQEDMLPNIFPAFPDRHEFDIYAAMDPAKEVGGDFYDFFLIDEDHLCMVMADVSGKGVPAALFMMASKIILADSALMGKSPAQILTDTNAMICPNNREEMFVTVWLGILEISTGRLTAANAGHEYPVIKQADGGFALFKDKHGFVIGGMDGFKYKEYEIMLHPGDKIFLYTDGVPEATNANQELFGVDRMLSALNSDVNASPEQILKNVRAAVDGFVSGAEQFDDLTMLCLEYKGTAVLEEENSHDS